MRVIAAPRPWPNSSQSRSTRAHLLGRASRACGAPKTRGWLPRLAHAKCFRGRAFYHTTRAVFRAGRRRPRRTPRGCRRASSSPWKTRTRVRSTRCVGGRPFFVSTRPLAPAPAPRGPRRTAPCRGPWAAHQRSSQPKPGRRAPRVAPACLSRQATVRARAAQFVRAQHTLLLTREPTFTGKAAVLPGCVFVVGVDTARAARLPRYPPPYHGPQ